MRKLASIRRISAINSIPDADAIEVAAVDGWKVVVKKGEFRVGDLCVYIEIDSWVPHALAPFLTQKGQEPKVYEGVVGNRLRTVKLRGQVSQGLLLPTAVIGDGVIDGQDVTEVLGIQKWEAPIPAQLSGQVKGAFPSFIRKTDQERIQNLAGDVFETYANEDFEITMKLDGTSCTVYFKDGEVGVCSRNLEMKLNDENKDNSLVRVAIDSGLTTALKELGCNVAVQGELMGPGIQGNRENLKNTMLFVFDIFDIDKHSYMNSAERLKFMEDLTSINGFDSTRATHIPIIGNMKPLESVDAMLAFADGPSYIHKIREGLVWKSLSHPDFSFKTISNRFLLKEK